MHAPIYLAADSRLLFEQRDGARAFLDAIRASVAVPDPVAAYVGASNGDLVEFYSIFDAAMAFAGIEDRAHVTAEFTSAERSHLERADLILLSGGDPVAGWAALQATGMRDVVLERYRQGAVLVGISAGAMQLGAGCWDVERRCIVPWFGLVPLLIDVHDEADDWQRLRGAVAQAGIRGLGVPFGGGVAWVADAMATYGVPFVTVPSIID